MKLIHKYTYVISINNYLKKITQSLLYIFMLKNGNVRINHYIGEQWMIEVTNYVSVFYIQIYTCLKLFKIMIVTIRKCRNYEGHEN